MIKITMDSKQIKMWWENSEGIQKLDSDVISVLVSNVKCSIYDNILTFNAKHAFQPKKSWAKVLKSMHIAEIILKDKYDTDRYPAYIDSEDEINKMVFVVKSTDIPSEYPKTRKELRYGIFTKETSEGIKIYYRDNKNNYYPAKILKEMNHTICISSIPEKVNICPDMEYFEFEEYTTTYTSTLELLEKTKSRKDIIEKK